MTSGETKRKTPSNSQRKRSHTYGRGNLFKAHTQRRRLLQQLTKVKTGVYIITKSSYPPMSHSLPGVSPFPFPHSDADKRKTNSLTAAGLPALSCWSYRASAFPPALLKAARSQNYRSFLHVKCFPRTCPKPKHVPESSAHFQSRTSASPTAI